MTIEIVTVPCLRDNYAFFVHSAGKTALIDAPEAAPINTALADHEWSLDEIWITHHHSDHIDGVAQLVSDHGARVRGNAADAGRLPPLDLPVDDGGSFQFADTEVFVMDVSGHTVGHIAFLIPEANAVFTADSLMALGCGRVFEGTMAQMWASLSKLAALPADTVVYSGHEYTLSNGRFAVTIEPDNPALVKRLAAVEAARETGKPTVPSTLAEELETNPFLRAGLLSVKSHLSMPNSENAEVFAEIRRRKDSF